MSVATYASSQTLRTVEQLNSPHLAREKAVDTNLILATWLLTIRYDFYKWL